MNHKQLNSAELDNLKLNEVMNPTDPGPPPPPPAGTETDPVFAASEAAKLVTGDKAKLDNLQTLIENMPAGPARAARRSRPPRPPRRTGAGRPGTDPVFAAWVATPPNVSAFANDAGYSNFNPNWAGELYNCFGIFDGGNITNGVRVGANQVDLQLYNMGQTVTVLSAGQKQLIGYPDYANPVPTVAACWADGVLRDGAGNAFRSDTGLTQDVTIGGVTLHFTNGLLTAVS